MANRDVSEKQRQVFFGLADEGQGILSKRQGCVWLSSALMIFVGLS
jgi:hypothetical protein